jgi:periplasmic protein CpxP/Spy
MKNNGLKYLVAIALMTNAATLIFFWYNRPTEGDKRPPRAGQVLVEALKFDAEQQAIFKTLRAQHHAAHDSLLRIIADKRQILYSQKQGVNDSMLNEIGLLQQNIERITYNHFGDVRKICTPTQQPQLDSLLTKTVQNILMPNNRGRQRPENRE